jgi:hypothetical protein
MPQPEMSSEAIDPAGEGNDKFANLPADLQSKVQRIADAGTLENVWHFFNCRRNPFPLNDAWADQGALKRYEGPHLATASDRRLKQLKFLVESETDGKVSQDLENGSPGLEESISGGTGSQIYGGKSTQESCI